MGGGLAGLSAGIALRHEGIPVVLWEAGTYPRHRVCGEFLSGRGETCLNRLGLLDAVWKLGARRAKTFSLVSGGRRFQHLVLPQPALCISRYRFDHLLAEQFVKLGGQLEEKHRGVESDEGVVRATGRRIHASDRGWRWIGLKAHCRGAVLQDDLEMHFSSERYVGICRIDRDQANVGALFRSLEPMPEVSSRWRELLCGEVDSPAHQSLANADFDEGSFCSVAGFSFDADELTESRGCCIGDAFAVIPPVTGNGMSLALESAALAVEPLVQYGRGACSWNEAKACIAVRQRQEFHNRLRWARWLQNAVFNERARVWMVRLIAINPAFVRWIFALTR